MAFPAPTWLRGTLLGFTGPAILLVGALLLWPATASGETAAAGPWEEQDEQEADELDGWDEQDELDADDAAWLASQAAEDLPFTTTVGRPLSRRELYRPVSVMEHEELQLGLSSSVPATLEDVPGFHSQYNGPGAASPVIRGLPGDRVLMLEDGHRTGDIYWTAADHGVMIEPSSAQRIEVIRGPGGLLYGANALGGVVNVIRDDIPSRQLTEPSFALTAQGESVNDGVAGSIIARAPVGALSWHADASARRAGETRTPEGRMEDTQLTSFSGGLGASAHPDWGRFGFAGRAYSNHFGVPGEFQGQLIPGGHPGGVRAEAQRFGGRALTELEQPFDGMESIELRTNVVYFSHNEIEGIVGGQEIIGATFDQLSSDSRLILRTETLPVADGLEGAAGLSMQVRRLWAGGSSPGTRSGRELDIGLFVFEELRLSPLRFQAGARYDLRAVTTDDLRDIRVRTEERTIVKPVEARTFHMLSATFGVLWDFTDQWTLGLNLSRAVRPPTIEELYSDGPHLADFSFDIGSPDLRPEVGQGADLFLRTDGERLDVEAAAFVNRISRYTYYSPTGETVTVFREGSEPRETPVFEARGDDALFVGTEARVQWEFVPRLVADLSASYVRGTRVSEDDPLPFIPPLSGRFALRWEGRHLFGGAATRVAASQNRVPGPIAIGDTSERPQQPTDGHVLFDAHLGWHFIRPNYDHTLTLHARNIADTAWRDHLSRIKDVAPQPGRNIQLTWKAWF